MRIGALGPEPSVTKVIQRTFKAILPVGWQAGEGIGRQVGSSRASEKAGIYHNNL